MIREILAAARRGVHVRLVIADKAHANAVTYRAFLHMYDEMLAAGIEIWEYPAVVHAKVIVSDDRVLIGTLNLDAWAMYRNPEMGLQFDDASVAEQVVSVLFEPDIAACPCPARRRWGASGAPATGRSPRPTTSCRCGPSSLSLVHDTRNGRPGSRARRAPAARSWRAPRPPRDPRRAPARRWDGHPRLPSRRHRRRPRRPQRRDAADGAARRRPVGRDRGRACAPSAVPLPDPLRRSPTATPGSVDDPYPLRRRPLGEVDLHLDRRGHARAPVRRARRTSRGRTRARPASASRSGRRTRAASGSSATSTAGTAASCRCARWAPSGVWELFVPGIGVGELYKFEVLGQRRHAAPQGRSPRLRHAGPARDGLACLGSLDLPLD